MIKEKQHFEKKSSSSSSEGGDPGAGNDNQMIKTPDNNSGDLHHDLDSIIIKSESDMTALIDNTGGDVADSKSGVGGGNASNNASPGSSNNDQKQQLMSNDICLNQIKHEDNSNNVGIKVEDNNTTSTTTTTIESDFESCDRVVLSSMGGGGGGPTDLLDGSGGVQPLMSNVLGGNATGNKQSNTTSGNMDAQQQQYMQQQSQIFVFSTSLANKSAESVLAGQYPTIIAYHCAQPRTKKFLEKHPLKVNQFNRQNPGQWMNNMVASQQQMKHQQQLNKMAPHSGQQKYGGGTPYSRAMKNNNSPSAASMDNSIMQQPGTRMPMWNHQGNHINDSGPQQQQQLQHPSNHNLMGSMCGPGNNGMMGMPNHGGSGPMGSGMLMNTNNNSNPSMMGGPGSMMNQQGNLCSMGPGSGGIPMNDMDLDLMDHHNPHHQHHPNPHHPSNMMDSMHRPMMGGGPHHPHHPSPHHPSGALHHRGSVGMNAGPPHHHIMPDMMMGGGPNKCQPTTMDSLMSSSGGPPVVVPSGPGNSPGGHNSLASMMPSLVDFDDPIGSGNSSLGAAAAAHSLTGIQVPDENLTPQQKQHREKSRATLRKLQQILFPENPNNGGGPQQQPPPVTSSSSVGGGPLDNCSVGGMDDLMPSIDDDLDVDAIVTTAAVTSSTADLLLPPKTPTSCSSDWQKSMFVNDDDKKKDGVRCGPPPSYHQTVARSASVPIVSVPSCSPNSPLAGSGTGVPNSNLSLPSPRTCSALNSPAGGRPSSNMSPTAVRSPGGNGSRLQSSNPGTPVHMSPGSGTGHNSCSSMKQKGPMSNEFSPSSNIATPGQPGGGGQQSPDGLYCHNKQLSKRGDEPNLMPVPSPQHIQYLNTFDGQELTIQKQPNTGLKDSSSSTTTTTSTMSPSIPSSQNNMDMIMTDSNMKSSQANTPSNHHSPSSMDMPVSNRYPGTPSDFASPSPSAMESNGPSKQSNMQQMRNGGYTCPPSPQQQMMNDSRYPGSYGSGPQQHKPSGMMVDPKDSPLGFPSRLGPGDMPLNPSAAAAAAAAAGMQTSQQQPMKHFDPISSLAQMNQQLANNVAGGGSSPIVNHGGGVPPLHHPGGPGHHHGGGMMSPYGGGSGPPMHMMGNNNDPMCGPMGMGSGGMHDGGMSGPPGSGGRMMYGPGPGLGQGPSGPPGPNSSGMSMGPGGGMSMGMPPISGGRNSGMMMQNCGGPLSPKSSSMIQQQQYQQQQQQRLMPRIPTGGGPGVPYNGGANIQVKPSAPNTIQYLPNNSRGGVPRGAPPPPQNQQQQQQQPGLDFLQRFSGGLGSGGNSLSNMDGGGGGKVPSHNLQYFPNSGGGSGYNNSNGGPGMNDMMCGNNGPPGSGMGGMPPGGPNNSRGMMRGGPGSMIRLGGGNNGMGMVNSNYNGGPDSMFSSGGGGHPLHHSSSSHSQQQQMMMMGGGSGGPPPQQHKGMMGGPGPPDATQPLPPSMGGSGGGGGGGPGPGGGPVGFRGGPPTSNSFIGPTTADPNYAQQFHNFQQQLYATNTRGAGGGGGPSGPGGGPQQFFVSK